ncbi:hypothetical protein MOSE0_N14444 [Monosporozyma servazzii]
MHIPEAIKRDNQRFERSRIDDKENMSSRNTHEEEQSSDNTIQETSYTNSVFPSSTATNASPTKSHALYSSTLYSSRASVREQRNSEEGAQHDNRDKPNLAHTELLHPEIKKYDVQMDSLQEQLDLKSEEIARLKKIIIQNDKDVQVNYVNKKYLELFKLFGLPIGKIINGECTNVDETTESTSPILLDNALTNEYPVVLDFLTKDYAKEYQTIANENETLKDQNDSSTKYIASLKDQDETLTNKNKSLKDHNDLLSKQIDSLKEQGETLNFQNKSLKEENDTLKDNNKVITKENEALIKQIKKLEDQNEELTKQTEQLNIEKDSLKQANEKLVETLQNVQSSNKAKLIEENEKYAQIFDELSKEKSQVARLERELQTIKGFDTQKLTYENLQYPKISLKTYNSLKFELLEEYDMVQLQNMVKMNSLEFGIPIDKLSIALRRNTVLLELFSVLLKYTDWLCDELLDIDYGFRDIVEECIKIYLKTGDKRKAKECFNKVIYEMEETFIKTFDDFDEYND